MSSSLQPWIEKGYNTFAHEGPLGLKIEKLAREVGKNKSSFYHYFADLDVFVGILLEHHLKQAYVIAEKEANCTSLEELIDILVTHKTDLLFNRQLRIHRERADFEKCFQKTTEISIKAILGIWSHIIGLNDNTYLAQLVLQLSLENFYLQITEKTLNHKWLNNYFDELQTFIKAFKKHGQISQPLDGNV